MVPCLSLGTSIYEGRGRDEESETNRDCPPSGTEDPSGRETQKASPSQVTCILLARVRGLFCSKSIIEYSMHIKGASPIPRKEDSHTRFTFSALSRSQDSFNLHGSPLTARIPIHGFGDSVLIRRDKQEKQHEDDEENHRPARISAKAASVVHDHPSP